MVSTCSPTIVHLYPGLSLLDPRQAAKPTSRTDSRINSPSAIALISSSISTVCKWCGMRTLGALSLQPQSVLDTRIDSWIFWNQISLFRRRIFWRP